MPYCGFKTAPEKTSLARPGASPTPSASARRLLNARVKGDGQLGTNLENARDFMLDATDALVRLLYDYEYYQRGRGS